MNKKSVIVQKYGGSSLATPELIKRVAQNVVARKDEGVDLVVVVSAMGKTTDEFVKLAHTVNPNPDKREMDMLLSVGERISISVLALAINALGKYTAVSYTGSQIGLITDNNHTNARVLEVKGLRLREAFEDDKIVVVAGFQGVSINKEITTLGRGGSDTTAVAIAAALDADYCEIMSDIDGIYTADPRRIPAARRIDRIHYDEALEMAAAGAKMLHKTSVEFAKRHNVSLSLGSTFTGQIGTIVTDENLSRGTATGVVIDRDVAVIRFSIKQEDGLKLPLIFSREKLFLKIWQCVQGLAIIGVSHSDISTAQRMLEQTAQYLNVDEQQAVLSLVGTGVSIGSESARQFFTILDEMQVSYSAVMNGELFVRVLVPLKGSDEIYAAIHKKFFEN